MKICITSTGKDLDSQIDPRFGRCPYFLFIHTEETINVESIPNESALATGGAGIQAAQRVAQENAKCVITGNIGPNAFQTLKAADIDVITGVSGLVKDVIQHFKSGHFQKTQEPTVKTHFGKKRPDETKGGRNQ
jgi:predicted Fe-Mo cluster-binding NifX family protein